MGKVTLQDIAEVVGVSKNTVSKALRGLDGVSDEVRKKILSTATKMGYQIKNSHKMLNVAVLCREDFLVESTFWANVLLGIQNAARSNNIALSVTAVDIEGEENLDIPSTINKDLTNGIVIVGTLNNKFIKKIKDLEIPLVIVDHYSEEINSDYINSANEKGIYDAINYLIQNGHKKIGFIGNNEWSYSFKKRYQAYIMYMEEFKIQIDDKFVWLDINLKGPNFLEDMDYFKKKINVNDTDFPTAWICANDKIALAFMRSLSELNIKVPEDVSVIGFDNIEMGSISYPPLTTINVPKQQLGVKAIQQLVYRINNPEKIYEDIRLNTNLIVRGSVKKIT